jgi:acyl carrier protein
MPDDEAYLSRIRDFMNGQDYLQPLDVDSITLVKRREELGITSLAVIMLVANYMEKNGVSGSDFKPEWVSRLDEIAGIISVFREIDAEATKRVAQ